MIQLTINGSPQQLDIDPDTPLLWAIGSGVMPVTAACH